MASPWVLAATTTASASTATLNTTGSASSQTNQQCLQGRGFGGQGTSIWARQGGRELGLRPAANLTVGQTITVTSTQGAYLVVGTPSTNGTASGTVTFTVDSRLSGGYILSITSGSIVVGGTTYTISSGTAQTGPFAEAITGQGTTTPSGQFLLLGTARGSFAGTTGQIHIDLMAGTTEYAVSLAGTVQG